MKKVLKYSGIISLILIAVAFILMMASNALKVSGILGDYSIAGTTAIFGHKSTGALDPSYDLAVMALLAWILVLLGILCVVAGFVLPLLKIDKFAGLLNICAVVCFVLGGIFMFFVVPSFANANYNGTTDGVAIGVGWVFAAIFAIAAGVFAILPAAMDFIGKKKQLKSFH